MHKLSKHLFEFQICLQYYDFFERKVNKCLKSALKVLVKKLKEKILS